MNIRDYQIEGSKCGTNLDQVKVLLVLTNFYSVSPIIRKLTSLDVCKKIPLYRKSISIFLQNFTHINENDRIWKRRHIIGAQKTSDISVFGAALAVDQINTSYEAVGKRPFATLPSSLITAAYKWGAGPKAHGSGGIINCFFPLCLGPCALCPWHTPHSSGFCPAESGGMDIFHQPLRNRFFDSLNCNPVIDTFRAKGRWWVRDKPLLMVIIKYRHIKPFGIGFLVLVIR